MQKPKPLQKKSAFLLKTYEILEPQNASYEDIITWHYDGIGFVINSIEKFTECVLPVYFKHSNFASFIRQLNMYGFSKKRSVKSQNYYFHAKFQKNQKETIKEIQRKMQKKAQKNMLHSHSHSRPHHQQHLQQIRISSQLSIQLQYRPEPTTPKPMPMPQASQVQERQTENKYHALINANSSLISIQFNSILQILQDLKQLKHSNIHSESKEQMEAVLTEYIQAQYYSYNYLEQKLVEKEKHMEKCRQGSRNGDTRGKSSGVLETEQSLKDKKDNEEHER